MSNTINKYLEYINKEKGVSPNTLDAYTRDLEQFYQYMLSINVTDLTRVNKTVIITYLLYLQKNGRASSTISRNLASIRGFYQYLLNNNLIQEDPTLDLQSPKPKRKVPHILTVEEIDCLLSQPKLNGFKGIRDKAMLELLYGTGIRVSELVALDMEDIDLQSKHLVLKGDRGKERLVPFGETAFEYLFNYIQEYRSKVLQNKEEKAVFLNFAGKRLTRQGFWKIIRTYAKESKIDKNITPQTLRHSFAAHLLQNGADLGTVQKLLGHSDISTTQFYYFVKEKEEIKDVYTKTHPRA